MNTAEHSSSIKEKLLALEQKYTFKSDDIFYFNTHRPTTLVKRLQERVNEFNFSVIPEVFQKALSKKVESYEVSQNFGTGHVIVFAKTSEGEMLVLRANHGLPTPEFYMDMEKEVIEKYKAIGIPSVEILTSDASRSQFSFDYQIMLPLPGRDLEVEWAGNKEEYDAISRQLGRIVAKQYQLPADGWGRWKRNEQGEIIGAKQYHQEYLNAYLDHDLQVMQLFSFTTARGFETLQEYFSSNALIDLFADTKQGHFVHHDLADHNIRYQGDQLLAVFDWENAVVFDPISELGSAPTWKTHYPREQILIEGFLEELGTKPENLEEKIAVYFLRTMLWKIAFALKGNRLNPRHLELFSDAVKRNKLEIPITLTV